ncbi:helix-hairpin-helix domain-containing protein [Salinicoccus halitifaciens]|uniref:Competence protein ComEA n=1 Tax=Salinicoccus halitifaciens TaxID=1073415 RepID=A0ABV2E7I5_9STAP|nr:helix-hairpin-helix domain-containing protein [Salinicoccus halitifaciens]MCD2136832.1 helix-hairpin-helix domain-containing protein [Salinicoccus halitifaciens]
MLKEYYEKYKEHLTLVSAGTAGLMTVLFIASIFFDGGGKVSVNETLVSEASDVHEAEVADTVIETAPTHVMVEVKGAVKNPGVFEVPQDARVTNVLSLAVVSESADLMTVNQSEKVRDEMVIYVPEQGEIEDPPLPGGENIQGIEAEILVNINTATAEELTILNGIGEKKAQLIVEYREQNGLFMAKEDLMNITGIGEKTFDSLEPYITIE